MARRRSSTEEQRILTAHFRKEAAEYEQRYREGFATEDDMAARQSEQLARALRAWTDHKATSEQIRLLKKNGLILQPLPCAFLADGN